MSSKFHQWIVWFKNCKPISAPPRFEFDVHFTEISGYILQLVVKDSINYGLFTKQPILGMVIIKKESQKM